MKHIIAIAIGNIAIAIDDIAKYTEKYHESVTVCCANAIRTSAISYD